MDFRNLLHRANLNSTDSFLMYGAESLEEPDERKYILRLNEA